MTLTLRTVLERAITFGRGRAYGLREVAWGLAEAAATFEELRGHDSDVTVAYASSANVMRDRAEEIYSYDDQRPEPKGDER